jgi:hypothetical protein
LHKLLPRKFDPLPFSVVIKVYSNALVIIVEIRWKTAVYVEERCESKDTHFVSKLLCPVDGKTAATTKHTGRQVLDRERHGIRGSSFRYETGIPLKFV